MTQKVDMWKALKTKKDGLISSLAYSFQERKNQSELTFGNAMVVFMIAKKKKGFAQLPSQLNYLAVHIILLA